MRDGLLMERAMLKQQIGMCVMNLMKTTNKEEGVEILTTMNDLAKRVEAINCKLAHKQLIDLFKRD